LSSIFEELKKVLMAFKPEGASVEKIFFARNVQSALKLGQARGVALLAAADYGIPVFEYAASEIKSAVVGYGQATKDQIQSMIASLLRLKLSIAADAADALAAAVCHLHRHAYQSRLSAALQRSESSIKVRSERFT